MSRPRLRPRTPNFCPAAWLFTAWLLLCVIAPLPALAQSAGVSLEKNKTVLGLGQHVRPNQWTPVLVSLNNTLAMPIKVKVELLVPDADQDMAHYQRIVTLSPKRAGQQTWLYAVAGPGTSPQSRWRIQVLDTQSNDLLDYQDLDVGSAYVEPRVNMVGMIGQAMMGLEPYASDDLRQESTLFVRGLNPEHLPDRWYGLSGLSALIWTPKADPADAKIPPGFVRALRQWVHRGGHLVIIPPIAGNTWNSSPFSDLLPPASSKVVDDVLPLFLGTMPYLPTDRGGISMRVFIPSPGVSTVLSHNGQPWGIAHQVGQGRVTEIGVDLTDPRLVQLGLPSPGKWTLWGDVFGWRGPALSPAYVTQQIKTGKMNRPDQRTLVPTGSFIAGRIAMQDTAAPSLLLAVALFVLYWVIAGPVEFVILKHKQLERHAWSVFVLVVLVFAVVAWGGAWLLRPGHTQVRHLTLLTQTQGQSLSQIHVHSWLSLYVPTHGQVQTRLGSAVAASDATTSSTDHNAIWSTGFPSQSLESIFPDMRTYDVPAANPDVVDFAFRSTAKQLEFDYLGPLDDAPLATADRPSKDDTKPASPASWDMPTDHLKIVKDWPVGTLVHHLPGALSHVTVVYCEGRRLPDGRLIEPVYWQYRDPWEPGKPLYFRGRPTHPQPLVSGSAPDWSGRLSNLTRKFKTDTLELRTELLTFYSMLPPPDYQDMTFRNDVRAYQRQIGRPFDLTALARLRCVIIIGYLADAPLPAPLLVDGARPPSRGDTIIRWIYPLSDDAATNVTTSAVTPSAVTSPAVVSDAQP